MSTRAVLHRAAFVLLAGSSAACDEAESPSFDGPVPAPLADRLERADAAFEGTVVDLQTVMSEPDAAGEAMPHTIVTYRVDRPIKSAARGETVNLRFVGGPLPDGRFLLAPDVPAFAVGDHDVLFVANNGASWCPLVDCARGRLRVMEGRVLDHRGLPILLATQHGVAAGELVSALAPLGGADGTIAGVDLDPTSPFTHSLR